MAIFKDREIFKNRNRIVCIAKPEPFGFIDVRYRRMDFLSRQILICISGREPPFPSFRLDLPAEHKVTDCCDISLPGFHTVAKIDDIFKCIGLVFAGWYFKDDQIFALHLLYLDGYQCFWGEIFFQRLFKGFTCNLSVINTKDLSGIVYSADNVAARRSIQKAADDPANGFNVLTTGFEFDALAFSEQQDLFYPVQFHDRPPLSRSMRDTCVLSRKFSFKNSSTSW